MSLSVFYIGVYLLYSTEPLRSFEPRRLYEPCFYSDKYGTPTHIHAHIHKHTHMYGHAHIHTHTHLIHESCQFLHRHCSVELEVTTYIHMTVTSITSPGLITS